jgi:hypothetical protein
MRKRGFFALLAAIPLWAYMAYFVHSLGPFASEFGSAASSVPTHYRVVTGVALLFTITGICLAVLDFTRWLGKKTK